MNEVVCHGIPDNRPLQDGDIVNVDVSVYLECITSLVDFDSKKLSQRLLC